MRICTREAHPTSPFETRHPIGLRIGSLNSLTADGWVPDLIHDHGLWLRSNHALARFGRQHRIPRIVSPRGMLDHWCLRHHRGRKLLAWLLYQHRDLQTATALHATSSIENQQFRRMGFLQPVICLPNGVTLPPDDAEMPIRLESETREVLFLSRIHPVKGLLNLVTAWGLCRTEGWKLRIVGSDELGHRSEIARAIVAGGSRTSSITISDAVHSRGKWTMLRNADLFILPSFSENFGIAVAEALAVGTPVITTTGTPWEQLLTKNCGWYVPPTVAGLVEALTQAISTPIPVLRTMGLRGQHWVRREFAWPDIGVRMLEAYETLLAGKSVSDAGSEKTILRRTG